MVGFGVILFENQMCKLLLIEYTTCIITMIIMIAAGAKLSVHKSTLLAWWKKTRFGTIHILWPISRKLIGGP